MILGTVGVVLIVFMAWGVRFLPEGETRDDD